MDPQMVQGLFNPSCTQQHTQALHYLQQMRDNSSAWQVCSATLAASGSTLDDRTKFVCLQVLEYYAKTSYITASVEDQNLFRQNVSQWLTSLCMSQTPEKVFIRNKTGQLLSLMFLVDFIDRWPSFMADLLSMLQLGPNAVDLYLKILLAIDAEVVDRDILHTQAETERNCILKDRMRERCVVDMTSSWYDILVKYEKTHPELVCHCLDVIGAYVSWVDINLIANDRFVGLLVNYMRDPLLREAAADCVHEIFQKGMDPMAKTHLIESFVTVLDQAGVLKYSDDDDSDYLVKLSRLVNCIGVQLIAAWHKLDKKEEEKKEIIRQTVENKVTLLLSFMASEYDDISAAVFEFSREYLQLIKQSGHLTSVERAQLENMLYVIISKTKYDESYNFELYGEDEAMFDEYRKKLKIVFDNLSALVPELVLKVCKDYVVTTLNRWQSSPYEDVEAAISFLYSLGEALPASHGNHFCGPSQVKATTMTEMMKLLVTSGVSGHSHPAVALQFFECVARYEKFFITEPEYIPGVLFAFLDQRGMRSPSAKVRSRTAYLFSRLVRCLKTHLLPFTEQILSQITDLLVLQPMENGQVPPLLSNDDQLYVYEAASVLIVAGHMEPQQKANLMHSLLSPVFTKVSNLAHRLSGEQHVVKQLAVATSICHATAVTARTSKAFSNQNTMQACGCANIYLEAIELFISCLNVNVEKSVIGSGVRQLLHRLVVCLDWCHLYPVLPSASQALLHNASTSDLSDYLPLINQIVTKFKKDITPFLQSIFIPLVSAIFAALSLPVDENEEEERRTRKTLQRSYYLFLTNIVTSNLTGVIAIQEPQVLQQLLGSVVEGAVESGDPVAQKSCFVILKILTAAWCKVDTSPPMFVPFLYSQVVPACFLAPLKPSFDLNDAQTLLALHESAVCLQTIYEKCGDELINFLRGEYLPKMELSPDLINEYCQALVSDPKMFRNYCKMFFQRAKT